MRPPAWTGSARGFDCLRRAVAEASGGFWPEEVGGPWRVDDAVVPAEHMAGAFLFLGASDTPNMTVFAPADARKVADYLRWVAPRIPAELPYWRGCSRTLGQAAIAFARACRQAAHNKARVRCI